MRRLLVAGALAVNIVLAGGTLAPVLAQQDEISELIGSADAALNGDGVAQDFDAAIAGYLEALKRLHALPERRLSDEMMVLNQLGYAYHVTNRYREAADYFNEAYSILSGMKDAEPSTLLQLRFNRAIALRLSGQTEMAIGEFAAMVPDFEALPEPEIFDRRGSLGYHFGLSLLDAGHRQDGREVLKLAFGDLAQVNPPDIGVLGEIVSAIGGSHLDAGEFREALVEYENAVEIIKLGNPPDNQTLANVLTRMGVARRALGDFEGALKAHGEALAIVETEAGPRHPLAAEIRSNRGVVFTSAGRVDEALAEFEAALSIYMETNGPKSVEVADVVFNIASIHFHKGEYAKALETFEQSRVAYASLDPPDATRMATALSNIGSIYMALYSNDRALAAFDAAMALLTPDNRYLNDVRGNRAMALVRLGRSEEAARELEAVIGAYSKMIGDTSLEASRARSNLGSLQIGMKRYDDAVSNHRRAFHDLNALLGPKHALTLAAAGNLGYSLLLSGKIEDSIRYITHVLAANVQGEDLRFAYEQLSVFSIALEMPTASLLFGKLAVNAQQREMAQNESLDQELKASFAGRFGGVHAGLAERLIADGLFSEAQYISGLFKKEEFIAYSRGAAQSDGQESRNEIALTAIETGIAQRIGDGLAAARSAMDAAQLAFSGETPDAAARTKALETLDAALSEASVTLVKVVTDAEAQRTAIQAERLSQNAARMAEARSILAQYKGEAVLYHAVSLDRELHLMVTRPDLSEPVHVMVPVSRQDLAAKVYAAIEAIETRDPDAVAKLKELDGLLIAPVRDAMRGGGASVAMLDVAGFLRYVPFAALTDGDRFLIEDFALANFSAGSLTAAEDAGSGSAGFGTSKAHGDFAALPGVARELEAIFKGADGQGFLDGEAQLDEAFTLDALKAALARKPRYLHIGSHFRFTPGNELGSSLLIGTGEEIGMNRFRTDPGLRFPGVDLLVLSACETARGSGAEGAEIESLGLLAQQNGAGAVLATLWPIADDASAKLMSDFYSGLVNSGLDKARALQRAQIAMIRGLDVSRVAVRGAVAVEDDDSTAAAAGTAVATAHPYFWSPFVLMGRWN